MTKLIVLGDSIMWGMTGFGSNHPRANPAIPQAIGNQLGWEVDNEAISGTKYADNRDGQDFIPQVNKFNFKDYDAVLLGYGINDFDDQPYATIPQVQDAMAKGIAKIRSDNSAIKIFVELPTPSFVYGTTDGAVNGAGISQRTMYDAIEQQAQNSGCPVYDWRSDPLITYDNRNQTLGDGQIHPVQAVQTQMANRLAAWIKSIWSASPTTPVDPTAVSKISLAVINDPSELNAKFNANVSVIIATICQIAGVETSEVGFTPQTFDLLNRNFRNYLIDTIALLRRETIELIGSTETDDGNGNLVSVEAMTAPASLSLDDFMDCLSNGFKGAETALNAILATL